MSKGFSFALGAFLGLAAAGTAVFCYYKGLEQHAIYSSTRDFSEEDMDDMSGFRYDEDSEN